MEENNQNNGNNQNGTGNSNPGNWNFDPVTGQPLNGQNGPVPEHVYKEMVKQQKKIHDNTSKTCRTLCISSLVCWLISNFLLFAQNQLFHLSSTFYNKVIDPIAGLLLISGYVLGIIAIVKYPRSTFARILIVVYIVEIILFIIMIIIAIIACVTLIQTCFDGCEGCLRIG